jgi:hypothetical protein
VDNVVVVGDDIAVVTVAILVFVVGGSFIHLYFPFIHFQVQPQ